MVPVGTVVEGVIKDETILSRDLDEVGGEGCP